jgi:plastocyanin
MSSHMQGTPNRKSGFTLKRRLLGLGAVGGALTATAAVVAMTTAVGGVVMIANTASTTPRTVAAAAPAATTAKSHANATAFAPAATKHVMIKNYAFSPAAITVAVGDTVTWTNMDSAPHTVTVSSGPVTFTSPNLQKGDTFSYTFHTAGTYQYYCAVHPDMMGSVTVTGSGSTPTPTPTPTTGGSPMPMPMPMPTTTACGGVQAALNTFLQHVYAGHLGESVGQQVGDISNVNQYVLTHTVLVANMLKPLVAGGEDALNTFLQHVYAGHLGESVGQQAQDILNLNQYVNTHTVLVENMLKPLLGGAGAC